MNDPLQFRGGRKLVFVSNCLLHQHMRAIGVRNTYKENGVITGYVKPLVDLLHRYNVGIEQLPCVEVFYEGLIRRASGQSHYNTPRFKELCKKYAQDVVLLVKEYKKAGYDVKAIIGVDGSPTCGVTLTALGGGRWAHDKGLFMKAISKALTDAGFNIPFVGAKLKTSTDLAYFLRDLERVL